MTDDLNMESLAPVIHAEVAVYVDHEFSDTDDLIKDVGIVSDDLSAIALTLEKRFGVKPHRKLYRGVSSVDDFAKLFAGTMAGKR